MQYGLGMSKHAGTSEPTDFRVIQYQGKDLFVARKSPNPSPIMFWNTVSFESVKDRQTAESMLEKIKKDDGVRFERLGSPDLSLYLRLAPAYKLTRDVAGSPELR